MRDDLRLVDVDNDVLTVEDFTLTSGNKTPMMLFGIDCDNRLAMVDLDPAQVRTLVDHLRACLSDIGEES